MNFRNIRRVGIIGAGVAGLATAKTLLAEGLDCVVFERGVRLGGVWADGYCGFGVQSPKELYEFPDWPLPEDTPNFTPGPVFQQYLEDYVDHFGFRANLRFDANVTALERRPNGTPGWIATISGDGGSEREAFDLVVVATGIFSSVANLPSFPGESQFRGEILHNSQVRDRTPLTGRRVAVLGYGKSATDIALEATAVANDVHIVFREAHWPVPRMVAGVLPIKWGALSRMATSFIPPHCRPTPVQRWLHGVGKPLVWVFWRLLEIVIRRQCHLGTRIANGANLLPSVPFETSVFGEASMLPRPDFYGLIRDGRITAHRTGIARFKPDGVVLNDGTEIDVDCVVLATGWKNDFGYLPADAREALGEDDDGFQLYRYILHPDVADLAFIGRATSFTSILTYSLQARWLAQLIAGRIELPEHAVMRQEIDALQSWKRAWMPFGPARGARLFLYAQHYHDELMKEMGLDPLRKRGLFAPVKELLAPYEPTDYRAVVAGVRGRPDDSSDTA